MLRLTLALVFIMAVAYVTADEASACAEAKECPCGSICNDGVCAEGCKVFDTFMAAGSEAAVYGRNCKCGDTPDERGMVVECEEGVEFDGAPADVPEWENNPACEE